MKKHFIISMIVTFFVLISGVAYANLLNNLEAYYPLDGNSHDSSGNNHHGTHFNNVTYTSERVNQAAEFDGASGIDLNYNFGNLTSHTISAWVKTNQYLNPGAIVFSNMVNAPYVGIQLYVQGGNLYGGVYCNNNGYIDTSSYVSNNEWHFLVQTFDGSTVRLYNDGQFVRAIDRPYSNCGSAPGNANIGYKNFQTKYFFEGLIDEVGIWGRALSSTEILELYNNPYLLTNTDITSGLEAYYPFDGNSHDSSGNNHHGTHFNNVTYTSGRVNQAAEFDGASGIDLNYNFGNLTSHTISAWVKTNQYLNPGAIVFSNMVNAPYVGIQLYVQGGNLYGGVYCNNNGYIDTSSYVSNNEWHFLVQTFDGSTVRLYNDGQFVRAIDRPYSNCGSAPGNANIGYKNFQTKYFFEGLIDEVGIWGRALSSTEILELYDNPNTLSPPQEFSVIPDSFSLQEGETEEATVQGGTPPYEVESENSLIADASINENTVSVIGLTAGFTEVQISDEVGENIILYVTVIEDNPLTVTPELNRFADCFIPTFEALIPTKSTIPI